MGPPVLEPLSRHALRDDFRARIGPGWWPLALACHEELLTVDPDYRVNAVKQKYGVLEFQPAVRPRRDRTAEAIDDITDRYREASATVCEICGDEGEQVTRGILELTRCQPCWNVALENDRDEMQRSVRFIGMRANLYQGVERCADAEYQARQWRPDGEFRRRPPDFGNLDFVVHAIFDDSSLADSPTTDSVGLVLIGADEAAAASELLSALDEALDGADATRLLQSPEWARTVQAADRLRVLMEANDPTLERRPWPYVPTVAPDLRTAIAWKLDVLRRGR